MPVRDSLFWDVNKNEIDLEKHKRFVIERILNFGNVEEFKWLDSYYDKNVITEVIKRERSAHNKNHCIFGRSFIILLNYMHEETLSEETKKVFDLINKDVGSFYLAGGTALALQFGHRISVDLDFFSKVDFKTQDIIENLKKLGHLEIDNQSETTINGSLNNVKISFFKLPYKLLFPSIQYNDVEVADARDIAAMKILAISSRGSKKDFVDLFFLLQKYSLAEMLDFFHQKYTDYDYNTLHILKSLIYFEDADLDAEPIYIVKTNWITVKDFITKIVDKYLRNSN